MADDAGLYRVCGSAGAGCAVGEGADTSGRERGRQAGGTGSGEGTVFQQDPEACEEQPVPHSDSLLYVDVNGPRRSKPIFSN